MRHKTKLSSKQKMLVAKMASWLLDNDKVNNTKEGNKTVALLASVLGNEEYNSLERDFLNELRTKYVKHLKRKQKT